MTVRRSILPARRLLGSSLPACAICAFLVACSSPNDRATTDTATDSAMVARASAAIGDSLRALEQQWADAIRLRDSSALERIVAPDFVLTGLDTTQPPVPRATWLANTLQRLQIDSIRLSSADVAVRGDTADATLHFFWAGKFGAMPPFKDSTRLTDRWVRGSAGWQVHKRTTDN